MPIYPYSFTMPPVNKQDIPSDGVVGEFLGISAGGVLDWLPVATGGGDMLKSENLSGLADYAIARTNIGLGTGNSPQFTGIQFSTDTFIIRGGAANLQLGAADAAAPVAQTLSVQSVVAGTTNTAGADFTIDGSQGTGTGAGGKIIFRVARAGTSGSTQNILTTALSIDPTTHPNGGLGISSVSGNNLFLYYPGNGGIFFGDIYHNIYGGFQAFGIFRIGPDAYLLNEAANTLALRNGTAAQTFRIYNTYTDADNYERAAFAWALNAVFLDVGASGSGTRRDLNIGAQNISLLSGSAPTLRWRINSSGHFIAGTDNAYDIGESGANRPRNVYVGSNIYAAGNVGIGTTAPGAKLQVVGNALFGENVSTAGSVINVSLGGSYGIATPGSKANLKWDLYNNGITSDRFGIGMSANLMEFQTATNAGFGFYPNNSTTSALHIISSGNVGIGTTSPTSKLHVVGDAVLTGDLLGTNYTIGVPTILTQSNISITNNHSGVADSAIVITPKGTGGVIFGPKPDGTATGGTARGAGSIDLQIARGSSNEVASGINSFIAGGYGNRASATYAVILGGSGNVASANYASISGGQSCTASGLNSVVGGGQSNTASAQYSVIGGGSSNFAQSYLAGVGGGVSNISNGYASYIGGGTSHSATGAYAFIGGGAVNNATAENSMCLGGNYSLADRHGLFAHANGRFAATGDAQKTTAVFRNKTTTNSAVELFLNGTAARYTITSGKIISMLINITGTKSDGSAVAHYVRQYSIKNIGGTTSQVYAAVTVGTDNAAGTSIAISADATNNSLKIEATGVAAETWRWVASVDAVEVGHGV